MTFCIEFINEFNNLFETQKIDIIIIKKIYQNRYIFYVSPIHNYIV